MTSTVVTRKVTTEVTVASNVAILDGTNVEELIATMKEARKAINALEKQEKEAKQAIYDLLGEAEIGSLNGSDRVRVATVERTDLDRKALKENFPEVWEAVSYLNPYKKLITE